jgi:hypothetical protein
MKPNEQWIEHMPSVYRIRHIPSGLYFCPSREIRVRLEGDSSVFATGRYIKSNLSKTGKTYLRTPTLRFLGDCYYTHLIRHVSELDQGIGNRCLRPVVESEWVIEEVT